MKTLRVEIMEEDWERLKPYLYHGLISHILRKGVKEFLHEAIELNEVARLESKVARNEKKKGKNI